MWKSEGTAYAAEVNDGRYLESDGKSGPPSWANDEQMQRDFATGVQILSGPDGLSPEALNAMFSLEQPLDKAIDIAGRSDELRLGTESLSNLRSRRSPVHAKKNK